VPAFKPAFFVSEPIAVLDRLRASLAKIVQQKLSALLGVESIIAVLAH